MNPNEDQFYIGWDDEGAGSGTTPIRFFLPGIFILAMVVSLGLVTSQQGFDDSNFEFGSLSEMEGVLTKHPVPMLKTTINGQSKSVLLLGFGKFSALRDIEKVEADKNLDLEGREVRLKGTRIYYNDKELLELTLGQESFTHITNTVSPVEVVREDHGDVSIKGEIYDPKCALGVMKPGYGKPHRSCAIRCISGGIPPVLHSISPDDGQSYYFILKGIGGESINDELLTYVADQVLICGKLESHDDWLVLYTDPLNDIQRLQPYWMDGPLVMCNTIE